MCCCCNRKSRAKRIASENGVSYWHPCFYRVHLQTMEEAKKQRRLCNLWKCHANRRIGRCKVVRNLTTAFDAASPDDSAVGSSIEPRLAIDHKSENGTDHVLSCGSQPARAEKRKRLKRFGHGFEATIHHAINMPETPCKWGSRNHYWKKSSAQLRDMRFMHI